VPYLIDNVLLNLVNASVKRSEYDQKPNKVIITESTLSRISSLQNNGQYSVNVSYIVSDYYRHHIINFYFSLGKIPEMYKCTQLKNKCFKATILTSSEEDLRIHPLYKILDAGNLVDFKKIYIDQYVST